MHIFFINRFDSAAPIRRGGHELEENSSESRADDGKPSSSENGWLSHLWYHVRQGVGESTFQTSGDFASTEGVAARGR